MNFTLKDLEEFRGLALKAYLEIPDQARLAGTDRALTSDEKILLAYYQAAAYFKNKHLEVNFIEPDSEPPENDYTY